MSKLVDKERLARLAAALDKRAKDAVAAEAAQRLADDQRIEGKADANAQAIAAIENAESGILAQAKEHVAEREEAINEAIAAKVAQTEYDAFVQAQDAIDDKQTEDILALQGKVTALEGQMGEGTFAGLENAIQKVKDDQLLVDQAQDVKIAALVEAVNGNDKLGDEKVVGLKAEMDAAEARLDAIEQANFGKQIADEKVRAEAEEVKLANRLSIVEGFFGSGEDGPELDLAGVNAAIEKAQDAADAAQDAVDAVEERLDVDGGLVDRIEANEAAIGVLNGDAAGSVAKAVADAVAAEKGLREAKEAEVAQAMAEETARVNKKIADDIAAESALRVAEEARIAGLVETEKGRAEGKEAELLAAIGVLNGDENQAGSVAAAVKAEADRAKGVEQDHEGRIAANEAFVAGYNAAEAQVRADFAAADATNLKAAKDYADEKIAALVDSAPEAMDTLNDLAKAIKDNKDVYDGYVAEHAQAMATMKKELQDEIDADVKVVADELAKQIATNAADIDELQEFMNGHSHAAMLEDIEQLKKDVDAAEAAIEAEVGKEGVQGARDAAIAAALEAYSTTAEMKAILGNVVNSLALTMENDQVVLKLGGAEGIALTSVSLDLATDDDIDAMIDALDAE